MTSPKFWSMGGGRPLGPPIAGSATAYRVGLRTVLNALRQQALQRGLLSRMGCRTLAHNGVEVSDADDAAIAECLNGATDGPPALTSSADAYRPALLLTRR